MVTQVGQHTPTPLLAESKLLNGQCDVLTPGGTVFATCYTVEDAGLIVQAVNSYEAMRHALKAASVAMHSGGRYDQHVAALIREALKLVEGESPG